MTWVPAYGSHEAFVRVKGLETVPKGQTSSLNSNLQKKDLAVEERRQEHNEEKQM
jgi:hypothetical protein